jgi:hypothetical protein
LFAKSIHFPLPCYLMYRQRQLKLFQTYYISIIKLSRDLLSENILKGERNMLDTCNRPGRISQGRSV